MAGKAARRRRRRSYFTIGALVVLIRIVTAHLVTSAVVAGVIAGSALIALFVRWLLARRAWRLQLIQSREITRYGSMSPPEFERALAVMCARDGCTDVEVTGKAGDLGADVIARSPTGTKVVLQAKRYSETNKVTSPDLQRFGGTCFAIHRADIAAVVTTSTFTKAAREYARLAGIRLIDATGLAAWASQTGPAPW